MPIKPRSLHFAAVLFLILMTSPVQAAQVHLAWEPPATGSGGPTLFNLGGYKLYYGESEADLSVVLDVGNQLSYTATGLEGGKTYHFVVIAYDDLGNESDFSNMVVHTALETGVELTEDDGMTGDGEALDDSGEEMIELTEAETPASSHWMNYRVTLTLASASADAIGVIFRYQDGDNYYRFSWSHQHAERHLVKRENGVFTLLATDTAPDVAELPYELTIVADGMILEIWINAMPIFSVADASFPQGTIALYASGHGTNIFDNVLVEDLATDEALLWDDFNDGTMMAWTFLDDATSDASSQWSVEAGMLVQRSATGAGFYDPAVLALLGTFALYLN
jgi:hypothetical protein